MTIGSLGSLLPLPEVPPLVLLTPPVVLLLVGLPLDEAARSLAIILIVIRLFLGPLPTDADPAAPPAGLEPAAADLLLRPLWGLLMDDDPPKLEKTFEKMEPPCLAALLPPTLLPADDALPLPAEAGLVAPLATLEDPFALPAAAAMFDAVSINLTDTEGGPPPPPAAEEDPLVEPPAGCVENLTLGDLVGLLPRPLATAPLTRADPPAAAAVPPFPPVARSSGRSISMTPTIPPLAGRIIRMAGRPSSLVPKVTCPAPRSGPPMLENDARICSTMAALMGKVDRDCWFRSSTVRELTRRAGERDAPLPPRLARVFLPLAGAFVLFPLLPVAVASGTAGGRGATRSIVRKRSLQQGHLFSVSAHLPMQSKQNRWVHPLMEATSVMEDGASRQMAHVKSAGGLPTSGLVTMTPPATGLAAGLRSISSISSSSRTMGSLVVPRGAALLAAGDAAIPAPLPMPRGRRVERRCIPASAAIRVEARTAALRVDRGRDTGPPGLSLVVAEEVVAVAVVPTEKEGVVPAAWKERVTRWELLMIFGFVLSWQ